MLEPREIFLMPRGNMVNRFLRFDEQQRALLERTPVLVEENVHTGERRLARNTHVQARVFDALTGRLEPAQGIHATLLKQSATFLNDPAAFDHAQAGLALPITGIQICFVPDTAIQAEFTHHCLSSVRDECVVVVLGTVAAVVHPWIRRQGAPHFVVRDPLKEGAYGRATQFWKERQATNEKARGLDAKRRQKLAQLITDRSVSPDADFHAITEIFSLAEHLLLLSQDSMLLHKDAQGHGDSRLFVVPCNESNRVACVWLTRVLTLLSRTYHTVHGGPHGRGEAPKHSIAEVSAVVNGFWRSMHLRTPIRHPVAEGACTGLTPANMVGLEVNMRSMQNRNHSSFEIEAKAKRTRSPADWLCWCQWTPVQIKMYGHFWPAAPITGIVAAEEPEPAPVAAAAPPPPAREVIDLTDEPEDEDWSLPRLPSLTAEPRVKLEPGLSLETAASFRDLPRRMSSMGLLQFGHSPLRAPLSPLRGPFDPVDMLLDESMFAAVPPPPAAAAASAPQPAPVVVAAPPPAAAAPAVPTPVAVSPPPPPAATAAAPLSAPAHKRKSSGEEEEEEEKKQQAAPVTAPVSAPAAGGSPKKQKVRGAKPLSMPPRALLDTFNASLAKVEAAAEAARRAAQEEEAKRASAAAAAETARLATLEEAEQRKAAEAALELVRLREAEQESERRATLQTFKQVGASLGLKVMEASQSSYSSSSLSQQSA